MPRQKFDLIRAQRCDPIPGRIAGEIIRMNYMRQGFHPCDAELARDDRRLRPPSVSVGVLIAGLCTTVAAGIGATVSCALLCHGSIVCPRTK